MKSLIIIDMLEGFCRKGHPLSLKKSTLKIEQNILNKITQYEQDNDLVIFISDCHSLNDPEINQPYPPHCIIGTKEAKIVDTFKSSLNSSILLYKNTLSITLNTGLIEILKEKKIREIEIVGVCTDICILFAVYELRIRGFSVKVYADCVLSLKAENQSFFLEYMKENLGAEIN